MLLLLSVTLGCRVAVPPPREGSPRLEINADAVSSLIHAYGEEYFEGEILPFAMNSEAAEVLRWLEADLLETRSLSRITGLAYALAAIGNPQSKQALLKKLGGARGGPKYLGVVFGGDSDLAHFALILAVFRLEGGEYRDFSSLMEWWLRYPIKSR